MNNDNNIPVNHFQPEFLKWGRRKCSHHLRLEDLCREVQFFICRRSRDHEIVPITASLYWNLAAIRIIGLSIKVRCPSGET